MRTAVERQSEEAEKVVRNIRRATRRPYTAEEKVRIVIAGLRGEDSIAELCRKEGINQNLYYRWSKDFLEAGKKRLTGDTAREATSDEVKSLRGEAQQLKELLAEVRSRTGCSKKVCSALGSPKHEVPGRRETRNHSPGRTVVALSAPKAGATRDSPTGILSLVPTVSDARRRGPGRWPAGAAPRLE
jgi:transposase